MYEKNVIYQAQSASMLGFLWEDVETVMENTIKSSNVVKTGQTEKPQKR